MAKKYVALLAILLITLWRCNKSNDTLSIDYAPSLPNDIDSTWFGYICVDWNKLDATGSAYHGDQKICSNWYVYGQNVYSVAEGSVVSVSDGMPDQSPVGTVFCDINLYNGGGNSVMIYIAGVGYTIYGHMIPNSIVVKAGQAVAKGQLIGKVGNSGNSMAPHLHFGLHTEFPYYISEGLPYCIDSMEKIGSTGKPLGPLVLLPTSEIHTNELVENCGIYNLK